MELCNKFCHRILNESFIKCLGAISHQMSSPEVSHVIIKIIKHLRMRYQTHLFEVFVTFTEYQIRSPEVSNVFVYPTVFV